jgi:hypothetical protein
MLNEEIEGGGILNSKFQIPNSKQNSKLKTQNSELRTQNSELKKRCAIDLYLKPEDPACHCGKFHFAQN